MKSSVNNIPHGKKILLLILVSGLFLRTVNISRDFVGLHEFYCAREAATARNYLQLGFGPTKFGPVISVDPMMQEGYLYYLHHPFLSSLLVSGVFLVFGVHEWSARLVPLFFSVLILLMIYLIGKRLWNEKVGLWAAFFANCIPMSLYYGRHVGRESLVLFFTLALAYMYILWLEHRAKHHLIFMVILMVLGCLSGWASYYIVPFLILHYFVVARRFISFQKGRYSIFILPLVCCIVFTLFLLLTGFLTGSVSGGTARDVGIFEAAVSRMEHKHFLTSGFYRDMFQVVVNYFNPVVIIFFMWWVVSFFRERKNRVSLRETFLLMLFLFGFTEFVLFPQMAYQHHHVLYYLIAPLSIAASLGIQRVRMMERIMILTVFLYTAFGFTANLYSHTNTNIERFNLAKVLGGVTQPNDKIMMAVPYFISYIEFYANREVTYGVYGFEEQKIEDYVKSGIYRLYLADNAYGIPEYLLRNFRMVDIGQYTLFDLAQPDTCGREIQYPCNANFGGKFYFLGYSLDKKVERLTVGRTGTWRPDFFGFADFEIEERDLYFVEYVWEVLDEIEDECKVFVHFENESGEKVFRQDHFFQSGLLDMKKMKPGLIICETFCFSVPAGVDWLIKIGVFSQESGQRLPVLNYETENSSFPIGTLK